MHLTPLLLLTGAMLCVLLLAVQAEIIKRVNPDGTVTYIVPQKVPSAPQLGPCGTSPDDPQTLPSASDAYQATLLRLQTDPTNAECRREALRLGRLFRAMSREDGKLTIYDESAIANDLNAAGPSAGGPVPVPVPSGAVPAPESAIPSPGVPAPIPESAVPSTSPYR